MSKVKLKATVYAMLTQYGEEKLSFSAFTMDMSPHGYVPVETVDIEVEAPSVSEVVAGTVAALREKKKKERAEAELRCVKIDEQINRLLCIENKS